MIPQVSQRKVETKTLVFSLIAQRWFALTLVILVFCMFLGLRYPAFATLANFRAVSISLATNGIVGVGMCLLLVSREIDLSVGSNLALGGAISGLLLANGMNVPVSIIGDIFTSAFIGFVNGLVVDRLHVNCLIATLGMMGIARGITVLIVGGGILTLNKYFAWLGQGTLLSFQFPVWVMIMITILAGILLKKHHFFRQTYYKGANEEAAILAGINVSFLRIFMYALTGLLCGIAGVLATARFGVATSTAGFGMELEVISAVVIGGSSLQGGEGNILGAFLGVVLMTLITDALVIARVSVYWHRIIIGIVLIAAVAFDSWMSRYRAMA